MKTDLWHLYENMFRSRLFEEEVARVWNEGKISGEMHLSIGEEAIVAGTVLQLQDGDAMALDHRGTAPLVIRGLDLTLLFREFLGYPNGLCAGKGGHMHLFSKEHLAASSGIVGASGPAAVGFALAARYLRPGKVIKRTDGFGKVTSIIGKTTKEQIFNRKDPLKVVRRKLQAEKDRMKRLEESVNEEIRPVVNSAVKFSD